MREPTRRTKIWQFILEGQLGLGIIGFVIGLRLLGFLQFLELLTLDRFQTFSPAEPTDPRITLVGIDANYLTNQGSQSLEYTELAQLIETVLRHRPTVVGVDLVEDDLRGKDKSRLLDLFQENDNLFTVEKIRPPTIPPLKSLAEPVLSEQVGFNDFSLDNDGSLVPH